MSEHEHRRAILTAERKERGIARITRSRFDADTRIAREIDPSRIECDTHALRNRSRMVEPSVGIRAQPVMNVESDAA